ncbi:hypothetical protein Salat_2113200 [Sesamum alatum]|uniref:Uncharacterized protein n=1 Tax=Sesamum alatum TaxID=300844 RepID=A0AAE2CGQ5_9LAMI|nr:hypothetical protein Salat_2113200 [Sesamum alatum]
MSPALSKSGSAIFNYSATPSPTTAPPSHLTPTSSPPLSNTCPSPYTSSLLTSPLTLPNIQPIQPQTCSIITSISSTIPSLNPTIIPITANHPTNVAETQNPTILPPLSPALKDVPLTFFATANLHYPSHILPPLIRLRAARNQLVK